jgi:hypothetical protein
MSGSGDGELNLSDGNIDYRFQIVMLPPIAPAAIGLVANPGGPRPAIQVSQALGHKTCGRMLTIQACHVIGVQLVPVRPGGVQGGTALLYAIRCQALVRLAVSLLRIDRCTFNS